MDAILSTSFLVCLAACVHHKRCYCEVLTKTAPLLPLLAPPPPPKKRQSLGCEVEDHTSNHHRITLKPLSSAQRAENSVCVGSVGHSVWVGRGRCRTHILG